MNLRLRLILALSLSLLAPSCFLSQSELNEPLTPEQMAPLVPGESTADDVLLALGAPTDVVQLGRRSAWRYDRSRSRGTALFLVLFNVQRTDAKQDRIWVFFDEENRMTHIGGTFEADGVEYGLAL